MKLCDSRDRAGARKPGRRIGRGIGSGKGKTGAAAAKVKPRGPASPSTGSRAARCRCIDGYPNADLITSSANSLS